MKHLMAVLLLCAVSEAGIQCSEYLERQRGSLTETVMASELACAPVSKCREDHPESAELQQLHAWCSATWHDQAELGITFSPYFSWEIYLTVHALCPDYVQDSGQNRWYVREIITNRPSMKDTLKTCTPIVMAVQGVCDEKYRDRPQWKRFCSTGDYYLQKKPRLEGGLE